jgi:hypothetical protein
MTQQNSEQPESFHLGSSIGTVKEDSHSVHLGSSALTAESLAQAARRVLTASKKATAGCAVPRWAGQENGHGEEFGLELDAALISLRDALDGWGGLCGPQTSD